MTKESLTEKPQLEKLTSIFCALRANQTFDNASNSYRRMIFSIFCGMIEDAAKVFEVKLKSEWYEDIDEIAIFTALVSSASSHPDSNLFSKAAFSECCSDIVADRNQIALLSGVISLDDKISSILLLLAREYLTNIELNETLSVLCSVNKGGR